MKRSHCSLRRPSKAPQRQPSQIRTGIMGRITAGYRGAFARSFQGATPRVTVSAIEIAERAQAALKAAYGEQRSAVKIAAADANSSPRAAENWFSAENPMGLASFVNLYNNNADFKAWARKLILLEKDCDPAFEAEQQRFILACIAKNTVIEGAK